MYLPSKAHTPLTLFSDIKAQYIAFEPEEESEEETGPSSTAVNDLEYFDEPIQSQNAPTSCSTLTQSTSVDHLEYSDASIQSSSVLELPQGMHDFIKPKFKPNKLLLANAQQILMYNRLPHSHSSIHSGCMEDYLKGLYGKHATWRVPQQRDAVAALLKLEQDVIVALGAGVGKTAVAILPSMVEDGYTVITVGLKSLMDDWKHRLIKLNVPHQVYTSDADLSSSTNLILVTVDRARQDLWQTRLQKLHDQRPVLRLVVDECHQFFTDLDFRQSAFSNAFGLRSVPCQLVLMSASLPPDSISSLSTMFGLCNPAIFRSPALSPVISFRINARPTVRDRVTYIEDYVGDCYDQRIITPEDRILVFVSFIEDGKYAAEKLQCSFYHGGKDTTDQDRQQILDKWRNSSKENANPYLVATPALSSGFDYAHVQIIFFLNLPSTMILFYQQAHRAGRDGKPAICMILDTKYPTYKITEFDKLSGASEMEHIDTSINGHKVCLRFQASKVLDGIGKTCAEWGDSYAKCDRCFDSKYPSVH